MAGSVEVRPRRNRPRKRPITTCNANDIDVSSIDLTDLSQLKEVSQRLNLSTRRPSTIQWKQVIELRKSMGLYGSTGEVNDIAGGEFAVTNIAVQNGIVTPPRPYSLFVPKQLLSTPASSDDDITRNTNSEAKLCHYNATVKSMGTQQSDELANSINFGQVENETGSSSDLNSRGIKADVHNGENSVEKLQTKGRDVLHLTNSQTDIESQEVQERLQMFCDDEDELDDDITLGISERNVRYYTITKALRKVRRDLITMRIEDNRLARDLLETRTQMNILKLTQSCDEHAEMLDDVAYELEEEDMMPGLIKACDLPSRPPESILSAFSPLRNIGVSRMNLNRRRFSIR